MTRRPLIAQGAPNRADRMRRANELRQQGKLLREIAAELGVAVQTVHRWLADPDGSRDRARKDSYRGTCERCGGPTTGCNGPNAAPLLCVGCDQQKRHDERHWTPERVLATLRSWANDLGRAPTATEANVAGSPIKQWTVSREFGSWNAGLEAAGLATFRPGHYGRPGEDEAVVAETARLYQTGHSTLQIAAMFGMSPAAIRGRLKKAGVPRRSYAEAWRAWRERQGEA